MLSSHKKKTDNEWSRELSEFAVSGKLSGRGKAPQLSDARWHEEYEKIRNCPMTKQKARDKNQPILSFARSCCTCDWDHEKKQKGVSLAVGRGSVGSTDDDDDA
eukprot:CAMPEP_0172322454 /NCGR_PEP_ID=MMETSP1058-20130122/45915_1 /TAXON_ID=83371 /ORGANISM="Detonula confervacea, Strain CCMP 353" /LENGTH=103 /DNA_ID=CAMNT_0013038195 /DNA_START=150 /DNA_END=457 /DNA_ORIENTATION=-